MEARRPRVVVHCAASLDGRLTIAPDVLLLYGDERWTAIAGGPEFGDGLYARILQTHDPQALLEGSGSFMLEDTRPDPLPAYTGSPDALYEHYLPEEVVRAPGRRWFTVVDGRGRGRGWMKEFAGWEGWYILVLTSRAAPPEYLAYLRRETIPYLVAGEGPVDLAQVLVAMREQLGVERLVSTAGGRINGALLRAGLVDEVNIEFLPALIGGTRTPSLFDSPELGPEEWPARLSFVAAQVHPGGVVGLRYLARRDTGD